MSKTLEELKSDIISMNEFEWDGKSRSVYAGSFRFEKFSSSKKTGVKSWYDPRLKMRVKDVLVHKNNSDIYFVQNIDDLMYVYIKGEFYEIPYLVESRDFDEKHPLFWIVRFETSQDGDRGFEFEYQVPTTGCGWDMKTCLCQERSVVMFYTEMDVRTEDMVNAHWINPLTFELYESDDKVKYTMLAGHFACYVMGDNQYRAMILKMPSDEPKDNKWVSLPGYNQRPVHIYHYGRSKDIHGRLIALYITDIDGQYFDIYSPYAEKSVLDGELLDRDDEVKINMHPSAILDATSTTAGFTRVIPLIHFDEDGKQDKLFRVETMPVEKRDVSKDSIFETISNKRESFILKKLLMKRQFNENMTIKDLMTRLDIEIFMSDDEPADKQFINDGCVF